MAAPEWTPAREEALALLEDADRLAAREVDGAGPTYEQALAQVLFEFLHLMADRALAHAQFPSRLDKAQVAGHGRAHRARAGGRHGR